MAAPLLRRFWYDPKGNRSGIGSNTNPCRVSTRVLRTKVSISQKQLSKILGRAGERPWWTTDYSGHYQTVVLVVSGSEVQS